MDAMQMAQQASEWDSWKAHDDKILVKVPDPEKVTSGGILIPETAAADKPQQGVVIDCGPGQMLDNGQLIPMSVKEGDEVLFPEWAGAEIQIANELFVVVHMRDLVLSRRRRDAQDGNG